MPSYIFVLCPPYSSSTLLSKLRNPLQACQQLAAFMPELADMEHAANFEVHSIGGTHNHSITDLNNRKIAALPADARAAMNEIFIHHRETVEAWG